MIKSRSGWTMLSCPKRVPFAKGFALVSLAVLFGGCSKTTSYDTAQYDVRVAQLPYHIADQTARKPDLEGDGREAQIPPLKKMRPEHDDPSEPWSRSYGERAVERAEAMPSLPAGTVDRAALGPLVRGPLPGDLPIAFRRQIASAMDE